MAGRGDDVDLRRRPWKNSWLFGAVTGLRAQLDRAASDERASTDVAALVRLDARGAEAQAALRAAYPKLESTTPRRRFVDRDGFESGQEHGRDVHLGGQLDGRAVRRLGG